MTKLLCKVVGVFYVVIGLAGLVFAGEADRAHNTLHFLSGLFALYGGFVASREWAARICLIFGGGYLAFGALGIASGDPAADRMWDIGILRVGAGDHIHHLVLGSIVLAAGLIANRRDAQLPTGRRASLRS